MHEQKKITDRWWFWALLLLLLWWLWRKRKRQLASTTTKPITTAVPPSTPSTPSSPVVQQQDPVWTPTIIPDVPPVVGEETGNFSYLTFAGYAPTGYTDSMIAELGPDVKAYLNGWNYFVPPSESGGQFSDSGVPLWEQWANLRSIGADTSAAQDQITRYMKGWNLTHSG